MADEMNKVINPKGAKFAYCKCMFEGKVIKKCECSKNDGTKVTINKLKS